MSRAAWATLLGSLVFTTGIIVYVYRDQEEQRTRLKAGLVRDEERRQQRLRNIAEHEEQQRLRLRLESEERQMHVDAGAFSPPGHGNGPKE